MSLLIGTGFYADARSYKERREFFDTWATNTELVKPDRVVIVDNSEFGLVSSRWWWTVIRHQRNLGHVANNKLAASHRLLGWSMSWIIPAMIAYTDGHDFIYKEQDCLAWGDWLPVVMRGNASFGYNSIMPCEQSLFYIKHDFILKFVAAYMAIPELDTQIVPESKFHQVRTQLNECIETFEMPCGRERPLTLTRDRPWYCQTKLAHELQQLKNWNFI